MITLNLDEEARMTLEELAVHHRHGDIRLRARGLLALAKGHGTTVVSDILNVTSQSVRNWAQWWEVDGIVGILDGHKGGRPAKLTAEMLETGKICACAQPMTLHEIAAEIRAAHLAAQAFSLGRLAIGLKACGMSFKRTRLALKKTQRRCLHPSKPLHDRTSSRCQAGSVRSVLHGWLGVFHSAQCSARLVAAGCDARR